jgi:hypothetical protein
MTATRSTARLSTVACLLICLTSEARAQQLPAGEPARFLQRYVELTPDQVEQARRGAVVTKVLRSGDPEEIALFGIVAVDAPRSEIVKRMHDLPTFLRTPGRTAFGFFGRPATPADAQSFVPEKSDLDALKSCTPGHCDVKMPARRMDEFRQNVQWSSRDASSQVAAIVRQRMADYVEAYRRGGTSAMVEYADQSTARRASDHFTALLNESGYLYDYVPQFEEYLKGYPAAPLEGVSDTLYWSSDRLPSLRPILGITQVSIYSPPGAPLTLMSAKQLYASHYFLGSFALTTILDRPDAGPSGGSYYMVVQRMRFDHLPSGGLLNIKGRVTGKMHDALKAELEQRKAELQAVGGRR